MENWQEVEISSVYEALFDGPHATPNICNEGPIFLSIANLSETGELDLSNVKCILDSDFSRWTKRVIPQEGDIVFTYEASLHRYAVIPKNFLGCLGRRLALVRPDNSKAHYKYLFYYFLSDSWKKEVGNYILSGTTVDRVPLTKFPQFKLRIPNLSSQKKIAAILSTYDDLIENNKRRIALLEKMAEEIYREWFVRFRFLGYQTAEFEKGIPKGWEVKKLGDVIELVYGKALKLEDRIDGDFPVYGSSGIIGYHNVPLVKKGGIIVGRKGNVGSIHWSDKPFFPIDTVYYVKSKINDYFLYYTLQSINFINNDSAVPGLNRNQANSNIFLLPKENLIDQFEICIKPLFDQKKLLIELIENLNNTKNQLLPRLISGKLSVEHLNIQFPPSMQDANSTH